MTSKQEAAKKGKILRGVFYDSPVQGLEYETQTTSGMTSERGEFEYRPGEMVTFLVGGLVIGSAAGGKRVTPADIIVEAGGDVKKIRNRRATNIARFLQSLDKGGDIESGIVINEETRNTVKRYRYKIDFDQNEDAFTEDANVKALFAELKATLRTAAQARNQLRRTLYGIKKMTDVRIATRDGAYLLGDIYRPIEEGKYPAIIAMGAHGKAFHGGRICNEENLLEKEALEDKYFEGNPENSPWETSEMANSVDWVPRGYVLMRVDARGVGKTPGKFEQFSLQEAKDFYDAIEWAARQSWCNGRVGIWGAGYYAMNAYNVAQLQPPSLKAMIPVVGDSNSYRDYIFVGGGLYSTFNNVIKNSCGEWQGVDWVNVAMAHPFDDPDIYGPAGSLCISPDLSKITVPMWVGMGLSGALHTRGSSEGYILSASKHKKITIISETGVHFWSYTRRFMEGHMAFFDYWLKGEKNNIMKEPPVNIMIRTGRGGHYWQSENEWPIARTQYPRYYLDAAPSGWAGDGKRKSVMKLLETVPGEERSSAYPAGVEWNAENSSTSGISFITGPLAEDILIAGYMKLGIWVSSTTHDMELHVSVRVMDENNMEVRYPLGVFDVTTGKAFPVAFGALKVSHRKLDPQKSTIYHPYHTHKKEDYQPLKPGEPVEAEVELWPTTALIKKGYRIRLDVQPVAGEGIGVKIYDAIEQTYQKDSTNTVYTGPGHQSYLQLPVIPPKK